MYTTPQHTHTHANNMCLRWSFAQNVKVSHVVHATHTRRAAATEAAHTHTQQKDKRQNAEHLCESI